MKKKILVISFSWLDRDPRVRRQLALLKENYEVHALGFSSPAMENVSYIPVAYRGRTIREKLRDVVLLKLGRYETFYWSSSYVVEACAALRGRTFDLIIANDLNTLPLALKFARKKGSVVFDAHEYAPREMEDQFAWRFFLGAYAEAMCGKYLPQVPLMMTVCEGIANEYARNFGVKPAVVTNAPVYHDLAPSKVHDGTVRMVHHGVAMPSRHLELMIEIMRLVDKRFSLDFILMPGAPGYLDKLKRMAKGLECVRFLPPVPMETLPQFINQYDLGLYLLPPNSFNNAHTLPNKFFEFIQARLGVVIGPSSEMAHLIKRYGFGVVADGFDPVSLAQTLNGLTADDIIHYKQRANVAAHDLCFEQNAKIILDVVEQALSA